MKHDDSTIFEESELDIYSPDYEPRYKPRNGASSTSTEIPKVSQPDIPQGLYDDPGSSGGSFHDRVRNKGAQILSQGAENMFCQTAELPPTDNATEAVLRHLKNNYKSFSSNADGSYNSMSIQDTQDFIKNLPQEYSEIAAQCTEHGSASLDQTLYKILTGDTISVIPSARLLRYYNLKNGLFYGGWVSKGWMTAAKGRTLPVALRPAFYFSGGNLISTCAVLGLASTVLEDCIPWRPSKIFFGTTKLVTFLPVRGAEWALNSVTCFAERRICGVEVPVNGTQALQSGPGLTIRDLSRKEVKKVLNELLSNWKDD